MNSIENLAFQSKDYARLLLTIGENRIELLAVEIQEAVRHLLCMMILMLGVAVFGLLAGIALTALLVLVMDYPPATVLLYVTGVYIVAGLILYWRFTKLMNEWQFIAASIGQLRKDSQCRATSSI